MKLSKIFDEIYTDLHQNLYFIMVEELDLEYRLPLLRREEEILKDFEELFMGFMYRNVDKKRKYLVRSKMMFAHIIRAADDYYIIEDKRLQDDHNLALVVDLRED